MPDQTCSSCRQVITDDDPSGLCLDCQTDVLSHRPGSITEAQRIAIIGLLIDQGIIANWRSLWSLLETVIPGWTDGSDLGNLSQQQAGDLLEFLEERRMSQEAKGL